MNKKENVNNTLCITAIEVKSPSKLEHLYGKTATIGTFLKDSMMILDKKVPYYLFEVLGTAAGQYIIY